MIRHAKNMGKENTDTSGEIIRTPESTTSDPALQESGGSRLTRPDETTQNSDEQEILVDANIVPPARPAARHSQPEKELQLKNRIISARMGLLFFAILLVIAVLLLVIPRSTEVSPDQPVAPGWPELTFDDYFSGNYAARIAKRYNDQASEHKVLKTASAGIRSLFGPGKADAVPDVQDQASAIGTASDELSHGIDEDSYYDIVQSRNYHTDNPDVRDLGEYLIVRQDGHWKALPLYSEGDISLYAGTINYIRQMLDESINIYVMPVPMSTQFYLPSNYQTRSTDMKDSFRRLSIQLISGIQEIDIIDALNNHNMESIYLRTDEHWTPLAAYYAAREFTRIADVSFPALDTYVSNRRTGFLGSIYELTGSTEILNDPEDFVYYTPVNRYRAYYYDTGYHYQFSQGLIFDTSLPDSYHVLLGSDEQIIKIVTDTDNDRKLLMVKDSYGNAMVPFLTSSFNEIYVVDQEHFDFNLINFANYTKITDLLFIHDYYSLYDSEAEVLEYITYSNLDVEIKDTSPTPELPENGNPDINGDDPIYPVISKEPETLPEEETTSPEESADEEPIEEELIWEGDYDYQEPVWEDNGYYEESYSDWENDYYEEPYDAWEDGYYEEAYDWENDDYEESYNDWEDDYYEESYDNWEDAEYYEDY